MRWSLRLTCATVAATCVVQPARADDAADDLLRRAAGTMAAAKTIQFDAAREGSGHLGVRSPAVKGSVVIAARDGDQAARPETWRFAVRAEVWPSGGDRSERIETVADGDKAIMIRHAEKRVMEGEMRQVRDMLAEGGAFLLSPLLNFEALVVRPVLQRKEGLATIDGTRIVGGVLCDVVRIDYAEGVGLEERHVWIAVARHDGFPRRVEALYGGERPGMGTLTLSDVRLDAEVEAGKLRWTLPSDYSAGPYLPRMTAPSGNRPEAMPPGIGQRVPAWAQLDVAGKNWSSKELAGSVVVLDFWATWCKPCVSSMPGVQKLHEEFAGRGVVVLGVNCWENADPAKLVRDMGLTYPNLVQGDSLAKALGVTAIPAYFVIGRDGRLVHKGTGAGGSQEKRLRESVEEALLAR